MYYHNPSHTFQHTEVSVVRIEAVQTRECGTGSWRRPRDAALPGLQVALTGTALEAPTFIGRASKVTEPSKEPGKAYQAWESIHQSHDIPLTHLKVGVEIHCPTEGGNVSAQRPITVVPQSSRVWLGRRESSPLC